jgi:NADH dehydrogenase FAD-containing subunit
VRHRRRREFPYDHLVLALGAEPAYFGIPGVEDHAISIKGISAAEAIRNRVIERYEETTLARGDVPDSRLTFVVIGGGATGSRSLRSSTRSSTTSWRPTTRT